MRNFPLFNDDIISAIYNHFEFFLTWNNLGNYALVVSVILFLNWLLVKFFFKYEKVSFLPEEKYDFSSAPAAKWFSFGLLLLSIGLYCFATLSQEASTLNNFDLMAVDVQVAMKYGILSIIDPIRFTPLAGMDNNFIYAVSHNFIIIYCWIILKQLFLLYLLYRFFEFIPITRRLIVLAIVNFIPAVFVINNPIFSEQLIMIFVILSLISLNKFNQTGRFGNLLWFLICANIAIYMKETVTLFYAGLLGFFIIYRIFSGQINISSFFSPFKTISKMPIEYLLFWSLFIFMNCFLLLQDNTLGTPYLDTHRADVSIIVSINKLALILNACALMILLFKIFQRRYDKIYFLTEGTLLGITILSLVVVFVLKIVVIPDYYKSYYLYLTVVFAVAYIFTFVQNKMILAILFIPTVLYSGYVNYHVYHREEGIYRRQIAEYIASRAQKNPVSVYLYSNEPTPRKWWKVTGWASALKYNFPNLDISVIAEVPLKNLHVDEDEYSYKVIQKSPQAGNYFVVHKINSPDFEPKSDYQLIFENKVYKIYYIEPENDKLVSEN